jgi:hypothetical protein
MPHPYLRGQIAKKARWVREKLSIWDEKSVGSEHMLYDFNRLIDLVVVERQMAKETLIWGP